MNYLSVCSGIEAASVAWERLGWKPVAFSEIEKFPSAVLAHHWPDVPNLGDMTSHNEWKIRKPIDLLVGGTPCQAFSVAGLRKGLKDPRGNLTLTFLAMVERLKPEWVVWENVPGVLSDETNAFGQFLAGLGELGYQYAYRVLDAQHFGVPQRRRRVFVVASSGGVHPAAVLFEPESLRGDITPSREAGSGVAALTANGVGTCGAYDNQGQAGQLIPETVGTLCVDSHPGSYTGQDAYTGRLIAHTLRGEGFDASEDGTGRGTPLVPAAFDTTQITSKENRSNPQAGDPCHPLAAGAHAPAVAFNMRGREGGAMPEVDPDGLACQRAASGGSSRSYIADPAQAVRRLTPTECERLQGFPDGHTLIPWRGKDAEDCPDGPRYKALGNSMAVPVMRWIGERIEQLQTNNKQ